MVSGRAGSPLLSGLSSGFEERGLLPSAVCELLVAVVSLAAKQELEGTGASVFGAHRLRSFSPWALEHRLSNCAQT